MTNKKRISKKALTRANILSIWYQSFAFNYETMQSPGWVLAVEPALEEIYGDDPDLLAEKLDKHFRFYNTNPYLNPLVAGMCLSIEESGTPEATDIGIALRTALMGPFAGLGDSLIFITGRSVFGSIAAYSALNGSIGGYLFNLVVMAVVVFIRWKSFYIGYNQGSRFITDNSETFRNLTNSASIIGLAVVGAMIPSMVKIQTTLTYTNGDITASLQGFFDSLLPALLPISVTVAVYYGLKSPKMSTVKMLWLVIVLSILLHVIGIL